MKTANTKPVSAERVVPGLGVRLAIDTGPSGAAEPDADLSALGAAVRTLVIENGRTRQVRRILA